MQKSEKAYQKRKTCRRTGENDGKSLLLFPKTGRFVENGRKALLNRRNMDSELKEKFEEFGKILEDMGTAADNGCSFSEVCRMLDVDMEKFGEYVFSEVGLSGDEVMELYRKTPSRTV